MPAPPAEPPPPAPVDEDRPAARLSASPITAAIPALLGVSALALWLRDVGLSKLDPNTVNLAMLTAGLVLHGSARAYADAIGRATPATAGIVLQYPFYAGIMGIMAGTGLVTTLADNLAGLGPTAMTVATFYLAGLVNLFVPSGGGQWAVQGPIVMDAALQSGADPARVLLALSHGDAWTKMVQPFWALPLLGICRVEAGDILGYTLLVLLVSQLCFVLPLALL